MTNTLSAFKFTPGDVIVNTHSELEPPSRARVVALIVEEHKHEYYKLFWLNDFQNAQFQLYDRSVIEHFYQKENHA